MRGFVILVFAFAAACSSEPQCRMGADCASGVCLSDGTCKPLEEPGGADGGDGGEDILVDGGGEEESSTPDEAADGFFDGEGDFGEPGASCLPNHDWVVTRQEMPVRVGVRALFSVVEEVMVDTTGGGGEERHWDFRGPYSGEHLLAAELRDPAGAWFAGEFPSASYFARLSDRDELLGVFQIADGELLLMGVVSPEDGLGRTLLKYHPPAKILAFPLTQGASWSSDSTVSGQAQGVYSLYSEKYFCTVDARGEVSVPYGTFPVLRVRVEITRTVGLVVTRLRSFSFVAECFGNVAKVDSRDNEPGQEFSQAAEIWRLSP
jgi:hypothetical protein